MAPGGTLWTTSYQTGGKFVRYTTLSPWILKLIILPFFFQIKSAGVLAGIEIVEPAGYEHMVDNKKPEFLNKFPHGKIPAFETQDGFKLFEGLSIARYGG
jgi:elongation factor 1-gamma